MTKGKPSSRAIEASITFGRDDAASIGRDRIRLLQTVARAGSITAGAKAAGITYKAAWDALDAMANLFGQPLLETRVGGRAGGGAQLTATGLKVIEAYDKLEAEMARALRSVEPDLAGSGVKPIDLMSGFFMRTSARNALRGTITGMDSGALACEVAVEVSPETTIYALVTKSSVEELGLCRPLGHRTGESALCDDRAGRNAAGRIGTQLHSRNGAALRIVRRQRRSGSGYRRRQDIGRIHHGAQRRSP